MPILALDIGGANIKIADGLGYARSWPFALWKSPEQLAGKLTECLAAAPDADEIVVTMTGELCDCFATKREGVRAIVEATVIAAPNTTIRFYQTTGEFVSASEAIENHRLTAASNWHALATFASKYCEGHPGLLIDIGSTTTDIIPIENGREVAIGRTDMERLKSGELVYHGVLRTPICAVTSALPIRDERKSPIANELFATTADAYLLLGYLQEDFLNQDTADGRPLTIEASHARMARMVCADCDQISLEAAQIFACEVKSRQLQVLQWAYGMVTWSKKTGKTTPETIVVSGQGEFLARELFECGYVQHTGRVVSLNERFGPEVSRCATAHALAILAQERKRP